MLGPLSIVVRPSCKRTVRGANHDKKHKPDESGLTQGSARCEGLRIAAFEKECPFGTNLGFHLGAFDKYWVVEQACLKTTGVGRERSSGDVPSSEVGRGVTRCNRIMLRRIVDP